MTISQAVYEAQIERIAALEAENKSLREQVAAIESREVCTVAHDNVDACGYCQRDAAVARADRMEKALDAWKAYFDGEGQP